MNIGKLLIVLSLIGLLILCLGTALFPQSPVLWLSSALPIYQYLRESLVLILLMQLATRPPRQIWFRLISGVIALSLASWSIEATLYGRMFFFDSLSLLGASIAIGVSAIEHKISILGLVKLPLKNKKIILVKEL